MNKLYTLTLLFPLLSSCASSFSSQPSRPQALHDSQQGIVRENGEELVPMSSVIFLSRSSYHLGCVEAYKAMGKVQGANKICSAKAKASTKENIIPLLKNKHQNQ